MGRVAFEFAGQRRNEVTSSDERNVMKSGVLWDEVITALRAGISRCRAFAISNYTEGSQPDTTNRYDKTDQRFKGMINLAATAIALK
jgi:hypothetical protein